jgi:hypothetical protein
VSNQKVSSKNVEAASDVLTAQFLSQSTHRGSSAPPGVGIHRVNSLANTLRSSSDSQSTI